MHVKDDRSPEEREVELDDSPKVTLALLRAVVRYELFDSSGKSSEMKLIFVGIYWLSLLGMRGLWVNTSRSSSARIRKGVRNC